MKPSICFSHKPRRPHFAAQAVTALGLLSAAAVANAQDVAKGDFTAHRFDPAPGPRNFFSTRTARSDGNKTWSVGFFAGYASKPLVINGCITKTCSMVNGKLVGSMGDLEVVKTLVAGDLMGSFTPLPQLQLGLRVPVIFVNGQGIDPTDGSMAGDSGTKKAALGDPAVEAKYRFYGDVESPFAVAGAAFVSAPIGHAMAKGAYIGDKSPTFGLRGIADFRHRDFSAAANLIGVWRSDAEIGGTKIGPEFRYTFGVGYNLGPLVRVLVEGLGNTRFNTSGDGSNGLEGLLGAQFNPPGTPITIQAGGGTRIIEGVGVPAFRAFLGMLYSAEPRDRDQDGILDNVDACPVAAEDRDGFEDSDGCPDVDNDGDRFADAVDKCPDQAEDMDGFEDTDGCPDLDNDKDGVPDERDACRDQPETKNGFKDDDGCPDELDQDAD
ncbi:MAG TPA: transporter, partial [Polyangiaceae bacterium]|nr:transporter [Polyangiaceae bacterium]